MLKIYITSKTNLWESSFLKYIFSFYYILGHVNLNIGCGQCVFKSKIACVHGKIIVKELVCTSFWNKSQLAGSRRRGFSAMTPALWTSMPLEVKSVLTLLASKPGSANSLGLLLGASYSADKKIMPLPPFLLIDNFSLVFC